MKKHIYLVLTLVVLFSANVLAQTFDYGTGLVSGNAAPFAAGNGSVTVSGNDVTVTATTTIATGTYNFNNFKINSGVTLTVTGTSGPLIIKCAGTCTINGTLAAAGGNGNVGLNGASTGGAAGGGNGSAGGGGVNNGNGSAGTSFAGSTGAGLGGVKGAATNTAGGGGGASYGATGTAGTNGAGGAGGGAGTSYANGATASGGSGGGAGGGTPTLTRSGGSGGGGGGGIMITAINVDYSGGSIDVHGGNGGNGVTNGAGGISGGGGGGSGGTVVLQYLGALTTAGGTVNISGGTGGGVGPAGGAGSVGRTSTTQDDVSCSPPGTQASSMSTSSITSASATINWTRGNGDSVMVLVSQGVPLNFGPANSIVYSSNAVFGSGSAIGNGYVVYHDAGAGATSVNVTGLLPNVQYYVAVYEYNGLTPPSCYSSSPLTGNFTTSNAAMTYLSGTTTQNNGTVAAGTSDNQIIGIQIVASTGTSPALTLSAVDFNISGTTTAANITQATIYYTGASSTFAASNSFGSVSNPTGSHTVSGSQTLVPGTNYFWIAYNISSSAATSNLIKGQCTSVTVGSPQTPTSTTQASRTVTAYCTPVITNGCSFANIKIVAVTGSGSPGGTDLNNDQTAAGSPYCQGGNGSSGGYANYTASVTAPLLMSPSTNSFALTVNNVSSTYQAAIFIDFNNNGVFDLPTDLVGQTASYTNATGTKTGNIVIPSGVLPGLHRMRVRNFYTASGFGDPCATTTYGESEDYLVNIFLPCTPPTTQASGSPTAFATTAGFTDINITNFTRGNGDNVLIVARLTATTKIAPTNGTTYTADPSFGDASAGFITGSGNYVVYNGAWASGTTSLVVDGLGSGLSYTFDIYEYANSTKCYLTPSYTPTAVSTQSCTPPSAATAAAPANVSNTLMDITWSGGGGTNSLVVARAGGSATAPVNGVTYTAATGSSKSYGTGQLLGTGRIIYNGSGSGGTVTVTGLTPATSYTFDVYSYNTGPACYATVISSGAQSTTNDMAYTSSTTTQNNADVAQNTTNQQMVGLQLVMTGTTSLLSLTSITFNTTGSTNPGNDITNAKIYTTGTSSTFNTNTLLATIDGPNGTYTIDGSSSPSLASQTLAAGTNYFWLTYDIPSGATLQDYASAAITSCIVGGVTRTPTSTATANRQINLIYCTPSASCTLGCQSSGGYGYISSVTLTGNTTMTNSPATGNTGYSDFTGSVTPVGVTAGQTYNFSITRGSDGSTQYYFSIWIDINQDGTFDNTDYNSSSNPTGERFYASGSSSSASVSGSITIPSSTSGGMHRIRFRNMRLGNSFSPCNQYDYGEAEDYKIDVANPVPMTFTSSTVVQVTGNVYQASSGNPIIQVQVVTSGTLSPLTLSSLTFNSGTSDVSTNLSDIQNASVYYTANSSTFSTAVQFGTSLATITSGDHAVTYSGSPTTLQTGTNYFWIAYDVPGSATIGHSIDAKCTTLTMSDGAHTPTVQDPSGSRTIGTLTYCKPPTIGYYNNGSQYNGMITNVHIVNTATSNAVFDNSAPDQVNSPIVGYDDQTGVTPANLVFGTQYTFSVTRSIDGGSNYVTKAYIDYNNDGTFAQISPEFIYNSGNTGPGTDTRVFNVTIPTTGLMTGLHRLRIRNRNDDLNNDPCDGRTLGGSGGTTPIYGETEDYLVNLIPCTAPTLNATANGSSGTVSVCSGSTMTLAANQSGGEGCDGTVQYSWYNGTNYWNNSNAFSSGVPLFNNVDHSTIPAPVAAGSYTVTARCSENTSCLSTSSVTVTTNCNLNFTVTAFLQGYYLGGTMSPLLYLLGTPGSNAMDVDYVTVELHNANHSLAYSTTNTPVLQTNGTISCTFDPAALVGTYYIVVKHRSSITVWSSSAVQLANNGSYSFAGNSGGNALGSNVAALGGGVYGLYDGDVNSDGAIDNYDVSQMQSVLSTFTAGVYDFNDITGDGFVDEDDYRILQNNVPLDIREQQP